MKNQLLFPYYIERRTNVPQGVVRSLNAPILLAHMGKCVESKTSLLTVMQNACTQLELAFSTSKDNRLLNVKRKMFRLAKITDTQIHELPEDIASIVIGYQNSHGVFMANTEAFAAAFEEAYQENRRILQDFFQRDTLVSKALPLISADFHHSLGKYLTIPAHEHKTKQRKLDHQLARLLTRATKKTSPFSTLTSVDLGKVGFESAINSLKPLETPLRNTPNKPHEKEPIAHAAALNHFVYRKVFDSILNLPFVREQLSYRLASYQTYPEYYYFLTQRDPNKGKVYKSIDHNMTIKKNAIMANFIDWIGQSTRTHSDLLKYLETLVTKEKATYFLEGILIKSQMLVPITTLSEFVPCIHTTFVQKVRDLQDNQEGVLAAIIEHFQVCHNLTQAFGQVEGPKRYQLISAVKAEMAAINILVGVDVNLDMLIYEDTFFPTTESTLINTTVSDQELETLSKLQHFTAILDQSYPIYALFSKQFYEIYGEDKIAADNLDVYHIYSQTGGKHVSLWKDGLAALTPSGHEVIDQIMGLKAEFVTAIETAKQSGQDIVAFDAILDCLIERIPTIVHQSNTSYSTTFFYQQAAEGMVLNKVYSGFQSFFSRFYKDYAWVYEQTDYQQYCNQVFDVDNKIEVLEAFGFNANVHIPFASKRLMLPFSESLNGQTGATDELYIHNCHFKYDAATQMVKLFGPQGQEISPFFAGSLVYVLMPSLLKGLLGMNRNTRFDVSQLKLLKTKLKSADVQEDTAVVNQENQLRGCFIEDKIPRITYGSMTLIRRHWLIRNIQSETLLSDSERYAEIISLFLAEGVPTQFFMKKYTGDTAIDYVNMGRTDLKPQFIDLASPLLFREFMSDWEPGTLVSIEEVYPNNQDETYIHEYQIELTTKTG